MVLKKQDGGVPYTVEEAESVVFLAFSCGQSLALCTVHVRRRKYLERILRLQTQPSSSGKRISIQAQSLLRLHTKQKIELFARYLKWSGQNGVSRHHQLVCMGLHWWCGNVEAVVLYTTCHHCGSRFSRSHYSFSSLKRGVAPNSYTAKCHYTLLL